MAGVLVLAGLAPGVPGAVPPKALSLPPAPSRFARLDALRVHYKSYGAAGRQALLFIHGWSCNMTFWASQVPAASARTRVLLVDLPGHGESDAPPVSYDADLFARAIDAVLVDAGVDAAVLVGHSMGTPAARQFYRLYPRKTLALVAVDGTLRAPVADHAQFEKLVDRYRGADYKAAVSAALGSMVSKDAAAPEVRSAILAAMTRTPQHVIVSAMEGMGDPRIWSPDPIAVPLLVILAPSAFWSRDYEAFVRGLAKDVTYETFQGVDHFLMMEKPEAFDRTLSAFLDSHHLLTPREAHP